MATTNFSFTTLNSNDPAGHTSINTLVQSIDTQLNASTRLLPAGLATTSGYTLVWSSGAITTGQLNTTGIVDGAITTDKLGSGAVTSAKIADNTIVNSDINSSAAIAYSKLNLTNSIVNADLAGSISPSKITGTAITAADTSTVTATMIANDAVALGTKTTGDYVASVSAAGTNEVSVTGTGEGAAATVRLANNTALRGAATVETPPTYSYGSTGTVGRIADAKYVTDALAYATAGNITLTGDVTISSGVATIANDAVTSAKILDGTIVNGDINASAGIAVSKLNLTTGGALTLIDSQTWTSSTTYTLPANAKICYVEMLGGAGGGGGGARKGTETTGNASYAYGGTGGGGGGLYNGWIKATDLGTPGNSISITIGAGGTGGAGRTTSSGNGVSGTDGGNTTIGNSIAALGGLGGVYGWWDVANAPLSYLGTVNYYIYHYNWAYWGWRADASSDGYKGYISGGGGGHGGGLYLATGQSSTAGGSSISETGLTSKTPPTSGAVFQGGGGAAGSNGTTGGNATSGTSLNGGGGGGYGTAGTGGNGADGGLAAGGGGGGAAATANAGNGGNGGSGRIKLWVYG